MQNASEVSLYSAREAGDDLTYDPAAAIPMNLASLIGEWSVEMATHGASGPIRSTSLHASKKWFAEDWYVEEHVEGDFAGSTHLKRTLLGYNRTRARFEYVTADNHDAVLLLYTGRQGGDTSSSRIDMWADYVSPGDAAAKGVLLTVRTTINISGPNEHKLENFYAEPGGSERLFLQYFYRRRA